MYVHGRVEFMVCFCADKSQVTDVWDFYFVHVVAPCVRCQNVQRNYGNFNIAVGELGLVAADVVVSCLLVFVDMNWIASFI